jgi:hypothetical protein
MLLPAARRKKPPVLYAEKNCIISCRRQSRANDRCRIDTCHLQGIFEFIGHQKTARIIESKLFHSMSEPFFKLHQLKNSLVKNASPAVRQEIRQFLVIPV